MKTVILSVFLSLLLLPLGVSAQEETPRTYVIQKGDTLWGLSQRFLKDPNYWPNMWSNNPDIGNPHFIYPGQEIAIYDGRIEVIPVHPEPEVAEAAEAPPAPAAVESVPEPEEAVTIKALGGAEGFVTDEDLKTSGVIVDAIDNRILIGAGDKVFVEVLEEGVEPGDQFTLFEPGKEVIHPITQEKLGYRINILGVLEIVELNEPPVATARILTSNTEIMRGVRLRPHEPELWKVALKKATDALSGYLVTGQDNKVAFGANEVVYVDLGASDGLQVGNLLYISRPRKASKVSIRKELPLPDILLGTAVVLETRKETASALIIKSLDPIEKGDQVRTLVD